MGTGHELQDFDVHEPLLTANSLYFKKALSGDRVDAKTRCICLPEEEPAVFHDYIRFLYTQRFCVQSGTNPGDINGSCERLSLMKLFVLAERLQDMELKKAVLTATYNSLWEICTTGGKMAGTNCIEVVYGGTPTGSPMRRLLVGFYTYCAGGGTFKADGIYSPEWMQELAINLLTKRSKPLDRKTMFKDPSVYIGTTASS